VSPVKYEDDILQILQREFTRLAPRKPERRREREIEETVKEMTNLQ
jgi:23S rRNA U2552 (ribose-2'-O)-methylase RlmE/FtsJ